MDPATKTNLIIFGCALLVLLAAWLVLAGIGGGGALSFVAAAVLLGAAVALARWFRTSR